MNHARYQFSFDCPLDASVPEIETYVRNAIGHLQGRIVTRLLVRRSPNLVFQIQVDHRFQCPVETRSLAEMVYDGYEEDRLAERLTYIDKECTRLKEDELKAETFDEKYTLLKRRVNLRDEDLRLRERQHELQRRSEAFSAPYKDQPTSSLFSSVFAPIEDSAASPVDTNEGLGRRTDHSRRQDTIDRLVELIYQRRVLQLCAPPFSGKTSLAELLHQNLCSIDNSKVYFVRMLTADRPLHEHFSRNFTSWSGFLSTKEKRFLIIDEGQRTYSDNEPFWSIVKAVEQGEYPNLYIFLFCSYDGNDTSTLVTPFVFQDASRIRLSHTPSLALPGLLFTATELRELVGRKRLLRFSETAFSYLYALTNGHAGMSELALHFLELRVPRHCLVQPSSNTSEQKDPPESLLTAEYMKLLMSSDFHNVVLSESRGCPNRAYMSTAEREVCEDILQHEDLTVDQLEAKFQGEVMTSLVTKGYLQVRLSDRRVSFACPIFSRSYLIQERVTEVQCHIPTRERLFDFLCEAVKRMKPSQCVTKAIPYERPFQMEFYRVARSMLPADCFINPDAFFAGFMDFYVKSETYWGIELVRNEDSWEEHMARFLPEGRYGPMIAQGYMREWALLDCRTAHHHQPPDTSVATNCTVVCFSPHYETATIYHGDTVRPVQLLGDRFDKHNMIEKRKQFQDENQNCKKR